MAKLRKNHIKSSTSPLSGMAKKGMLFAFLLLGVLALLNKFMGFFYENDKKSDIENSEPVKIDPIEDILFLPSVRNGKIYQHKYYTLSYVEKFEQPEWVAHELKKETLNTQWVARTNDYRSDPTIETESATPKDYSHSGYDRGHLVPAADMAFATDAMSETFFMSNMCPQDHAFNGGIWRELEELTRKWARKFKKLYVISGPVLNKNNYKKIGKNKVAVPEMFFKVLLDLTEPEIKGIGFVFPNEVSDKPLHDYSMTIDEVEEITGLDFFNDLLEDEVEEKIESKIDKSLWKTSEHKFKLRVEKWNLK